MVKLFVGNLTPGVDAKKLKTLFSQYGRVIELDCIKNFAFVHMATEEEADRAVRMLDNHNLDGRPIHIEKSTSRLRKAPGMGAVCYSCGALDHKTPQCPRDPAKGPRSSPLGNGSARNNPYPQQAPRREGAAGFGNGPRAGYANGPGAYPGFQPTPGPFPASLQQPSPTYAAPQPGYQAPAPSYAAPPPATNMPPPATQPPPVAYAPTDPMMGGGDPDPLISHPTDRDLEPLWKEYSESRERYFYFREKLTKEMRARSATQPGAYGAVGSGYATQPGYAPQTYAAPGYSAPPSTPAFTSPPPGEYQAPVGYAQPGSGYSTPGYSSYASTPQPAGYAQPAASAYGSSQTWSTGSSSGAGWPSGTTPTRLF